MPLWLQLLLVPALIGMNAFFVAAEYALVAMRGSQIEMLRARGAVASAAAMQRLKDDMSGALGAIQVCITMTNLLLGWIGEPAMSAVLVMALGPLGRVMPEPAFRGASLALSFVIVTLLTVVLSELLPKALTLQHTMAVTRLTARPMLRVRQGITPLVWLMNKLAGATTWALGLGPVTIEDAVMTVDELRVVAGEAADAGALTPREQSLILNSLALGRRLAREIMVPRVRVSYLDLRWTMGENRRVMNEHLYSRMPLTDGGMDRVVGVVYTKEYLAACEDAGDADAGFLSLIARPAHFAPVTVSLDGLLTLFREKRTHLVHLADEHGGIAGIVTLADVVDELIGPVVSADEGQRPTAAGPLPAAAGEPSVVPGDTPLHELAASLGLDGWGAREGVTTVAGLLAKRLGRIPRSGDAVEVDRVRLTAIEADGRAVRRVGVSAPR